MLTSTFSILVGVLSFNIYIKIRESGLRNSLHLSGTLPGFLAGGCAACGTSVIPVLGLGAAGILFPFSSNLWRLAAVILLLFSLSYVEPSKCRV
ncbi:MAG: hypothetical protein ACLFRK_02765 [Candidatus Nanohaloarchaea archaeon]